MKNRLYLDIHVLQTVPPSCINRDDTGSPKTAVYGGTTRSRVSSQAWKNAMRNMFREEIFSSEELGLRTKYVIDMVESEILKLNPDADAKKLAKEVLNAAGIKIKENKKEGTAEPKPETAEALFFMSHKQAEELANIAIESDSDDKKSKNDRCKNALKNNPSIDIALFGRMLASDPTMNFDATAQVAHSISTHTIQNEYDYFTAVDDLSPEDTAGAGHLGTNEFNSSTLYRYATVNLSELASSLKNDTSKAVRGFIDAFVRSMPTGKQNSFANRTLPSMVYVTIRRDQPINLCGAFEKPIKPGAEGYAAISEEQLTSYAKSVYENYAAKPCCAFAVGEAIGNIAELMSFNDLLSRVVTKADELLKGSESE